MKYKNQLLNNIIEHYNSYYPNSLGLQNLTRGYLEMMKKGAKIHIKPENRGKFSKAAERAGQSVQKYAKSILGNPDATPLQKKRAQFAVNSKKWNSGK